MVSHCIILYQTNHMKILFFLFAIALLNNKLAVGQETDLKSFTLQGTINVDTGEISLIMIGDTSLYPKSVRYLTAPITNGKFTFKNEIPHSMAYLLGTTSSSYLS
jgi:hypothetical protein